MSIQLVLSHYLAGLRERDELDALLPELLLVRLVNEHLGCRLPVYDGQTIDVTLMMAALMGESDQLNATHLVSDITARLYRALRSSRFLPVDTDLLEDAVALNVTGTADAREFFETSTLVPALASVAAFLNDEQTLKHLRDDLQPLLEGVTLERWFPEVGLETMTGSNQSVQEVGVSRAISSVRATAAEEVEASLKAVSDTDPTAFKWHGTPWSVLVALSSRIHRHPLPTWFLAEQANLCQLCKAATAT